jgi:hypothetical protein
MDFGIWMTPDRAERRPSPERAMLDTANTTRTQLIDPISACRGAVRAIMVLTFTGSPACRCGGRCSSHAIGALVQFRLGIIDGVFF